MAQLWFLSCATRRDQSGSCGWSRPQAWSFLTRATSPLWERLSAARKEALTDPGAAPDPAGQSHPLSWESAPGTWRWPGRQLLAVLGEMDTCSQEAQSCPASHLTGLLSSFSFDPMSFPRLCPSGCPSVSLLPHKRTSPDSPQSWSLISTGSEVSNSSRPTRHQALPSAPLPLHPEPGPG